MVGEITNSILNTIKKLSGLEVEITHFDTDLLIHINSAIANLTELGIGPVDGLVVEGPDESWVDLLGDRKYLNDVKTYVYLKTRLPFDPPTNSFLVATIESQIKELEWRLNAKTERRRDTWMD